MLLLAPAPAAQLLLLMERAPGSAGPARCATRGAGIAAPLRAPPLPGAGRGSRLRRAPLPSGRPWQGAATRPPAAAGPACHVAVLPGASAGLKHPRLLKG